MNDFEQSLIASAKSDGMSPAKKRALAASFAGVATLGVAGTAKAATGAAAAKKGATVALVKWLAVGVTGTALVAGGTKTALHFHEATRTEHAPHGQSPVNVPVPVPAPTPRTESTPAGPAPAEPAPVDPVIEPPPMATAAPIVRAATKPAAPQLRPISDELRVIDRARTALSSNDLAGADAALAEHARDFPNGVFADEARVLRIDALAKRGDRARAAAAAKAYLAAHPESPYADRVRAYVEGAP